MTAVYRGYDQAALDRQYDNQRHRPGFEAVIDRYAALSEAARARFARRLDLRYGPGPRQALDVMAPEGAEEAPVLVFLHGGAWRATGKAWHAFPALGLCPAGAVLVAGGFDLAPEVPLAEMARQAADLVAFVHGEARAFGGDPRRIVVAGHSSGAHLAALVAGHDFAARGLPADLVRGAVLVSGVYDLEPVRLSYRNGYLDLDAAGARALSPLHRPPRPGLPVEVFATAADTDEFRRQSRALAEAWSGAGAACGFEELAGRDHYDVALEFAEKDSAIVGACRRLLGV